MIREAKKIDKIVDRNTGLTWAQWLATRPECVQKLAVEFPPNTVVGQPSGNHWVIGWTEDDKLIISGINPNENYEGAMANKKYLCASHLRDGSIPYAKSRAI